MKESKSKARLLRLPPQTEDENINVIIETPKGSPYKFKYDEKLGLFSLAHVLTTGLVFPFDFGFVPGTRAPDGDPLDVLVLMDAPVFAGCLLTARLLGNLSAEQTEGEKMTHNDRLIAVASVARTCEEWRSLDDLGHRLIDEIEHFFVSYNEMRNRKFRVVERQGPAEARKVLRKSIRAAKRKAA